MNNLKISHKIFLLSAVIIILFSLAVGLTFGRLKAGLYQGKQAAVRNAVDSTWGIVDHYVKQVQKGVLSEAEAQQAAKEAVRHIRYQGGGYFWINDLAPAMVMHPIKPALEGKDLSGTRDPDGKALFVEFVKTVKAKGQGFVDYKWPKPGFDAPVPKVSFVRMVPEWGWVIGSGLYLDDVSAETTKVGGLILAIVAAVLIVAVVLVLLTARSISAPMERAVEMIEELSRGHLGRRLNMKRADEIGRMAATMDAFADDLEKEVVTPLRLLASGDLSFEVSPRDEKDQIRGSLKKLAGDLSDMIGQIQISGEQIASGSSQVADSGQSLSEGATVQASSLEEISSSMSEMASQTSMNAQNAGQANSLAGEAKIAAESGNNQMREMVVAMGEINEAGRNISRIIKVIDEIAFQTNLLALNAAVEAARAGVHGKGFAVVAEEVRNLAARSAKAASETSEMIEGSVAKAERGTEIAGRTAEALDGIVAGVTEVTDLVAEIAAASSEQAQGISQVNQGLSQIDQVTQQNTATAEETAAAAEQLSSQATHLQQMLKRFDLGGASRVEAAPFQAQVERSPEPSWGGLPPAETPSEIIALDDAEFGKY